MNNYPQTTSRQLLLEELEPRLMLSTIQILAAGVTNQESMELLIDESPVAAWSNIGGDAYGGQFQTYTWQTNDNIDASQVRIAFTNDFYDSATNQDRNLRVDAIRVDGQRFETEAPDTFSTGTYLSSDGIVPGFRESEYLHGNGYLQFRATSTGSTIVIDAAGETGQEEMQLLIDGQPVKTWSNIGTSQQSYSYSAGEQLSVEQIRVAFTNDDYDAATGVDRNLIVDKIKLDGTVYQSESPSTYSTGTWLPGIGVVAGYPRSETLHSGGYFQYSDSTGEQTQVTVNASGQTGDERFQLLIDGTRVGTYSVSQSQSAFTYTAEGNVSVDQIRIRFINDDYNGATGYDRNLNVDSIEIGNVVYQTEAPTVYSTGTYLSADGVQPGFRQSETLHVNGYFQFGQTPSESESLIDAGDLGVGSEIIAVAENGRIATSSHDGKEIRLLNTNGNPVSSFGNNGVANLETLTGLSANNDFSMTEIEFFPDGSLLLGGRNFNFVGVSHPFLLKITPSGEIDDNFAANGLLDSTQIGKPDAFGESKFTFLVNDQGKVVVIGNSYQSEKDIAMIRLNADGTEDAGFGNGGELVILGFAFGNLEDHSVMGAELLDEGSILLGISTDSFNEEDRSFNTVIRITPSGSIDSSFGVNGFVTVRPTQRFSSYSEFRVDNAGRAIFANGEELVRFTANGSLDNSFGDAGLFEYGGELSGVSFDRFRTATIDSQNRVILTSNIIVQTGKLQFDYRGTTVLRISASGALDTQFDDDGIQSLSVSSRYAAAIDGQGRYLLAVGNLGVNVAVTDVLGRYRFG